MRIFALCFLFSAAVAQSLPEGPGKDLVEAICSECHAPTKVIGKQWTKAQWADKVLEMLQEAPDVTQDEREQIVNYLARNFPKPGAEAAVNVNKATAKDLETELGFSAKEAQAIVQYRESKGKFKTAEDVKKVPGVDGAKVEAKRDRLEF